MNPSAVDASDVAVGGKGQETPALRVWILDAARAPAALGVIGYHVLGSTLTHLAPDRTLPWVGWLRHGGVFGVCLFFYLSGFGTHLSTLRRQDSDRVQWLTFLQRRLRRLYPPYVAALCLAIGLDALWPFLRHRPVLEHVPGGWDIAAHAVLVQTWWPSTFFGIVPALWFVAVVAQMYLLYPLFLLLCRRWGETGALLVALLLTLAWRLAVEPMANPSNANVWAVWWMNAPSRWFEWCLGAWSARAIYDSRRLGWGWGLLAAAALLVWIPLGESVILIYEPAIALLLGVVLWSLVSGVRSASPPGILWPCLLFAEISYSAYLVHQIFLPFITSAVPAARLNDAMLWLVTFCLTLILTLPVAWCLHRWLEASGRRTT